MFRIGNRQAPLCAAEAPLCAAEAAAVQRLAESRGELLWEAGATDVKSEAGYTACTVFLSSIDQAAQALGLTAGPRGYRSKFTNNYRALFPDCNRHYRVDVLEASVDQQFDIWVNGQKFELDAEAVEHARAVQRGWLDLIVVLDRWQAAETRPFFRPELTRCLTTFDDAWAAFEHRYISALIAIEEQARQLVVSAVTFERSLPRGEPRGAPADPADDAGCAAAPGRAADERSFVECVARLNSVANHKGKGRDDLGMDVLEAAREVMQGEGDGQRKRGREAAEVLAGDVVASYGAMRGYIRKVGSCLEHVDPHLCNNVGLVARLVDYEEAWETAARYMRRRPLLDAVCDVFAEVREAERLAPELSAMVEDCDVELFMVLPRLVVLGFLADPRAPRTELVRALLPHRFGPLGELMKVDPELKALYSKYKETVQLLSSTMSPGRTPAQAKAVTWERLLRQAVLGTADDSLSGMPMEAQKAARDLLLAVESWSLELQRHCPEDWNQCSAVLVHCLTGGGPKAAAGIGKFQV